MLRNSECSCLYKEKSDCPSQPDSRSFLRLLFGFGFIFPHNKSEIELVGSCGYNSAKHCTVNVLVYILASFLVV